MYPGELLTFAVLVRRTQSLVCFQSTLNAGEQID